MRRPAALTRWRVAVAVATASVVLSTCAGGPEQGPAPVPVPVVVAEPVPLAGSGLVPEPTAVPTPPTEVAGDSEVTDDPGSASPPSPPDDPDGPSSSDAAAFLASDALADLKGREHVVVDLDGDSWPEVVTAGIQDLVGVVHVAWWTADGYEVMATGVAGPGRGVADLRAGDVNEDEVTELLVMVEGEGLRSMALWAVPGRAQLQPLEADGGCNDGRHVYGVTKVRLAAQTDAPPVIVADCDESPLPVADWSEHRWAWEDGVYRHQPQSRPGRADDNPGRGGGERAEGGEDAPGAGNEGRGDG